MKRGLILVLFLIGLISLSLVSASWYSDLFEKKEITGKAISSELTEQWANEADSGTYYNENWKIEFATGASDGACTFWKAKSAWCKKQLEYSSAEPHGSLWLGFEKPVYATGVEIYFTGLSKNDFNLDKVELYNLDKASWIDSEIIWDGTNTNCKLTIDFAKKEYLTNAVRLGTKSGFWGCIDAVKLIGYEDVEELKISNVYPSGVINTATSPTEVKLSLDTSKTAACYFKLSTENSYVAFLNTYSTGHSQKFTLMNKNYDIDIKCTDSNGQEAYDSTSFEIKLGPIEEPTCTDSDGGRDYYMKGIVSYGNWTRTDRCGLYDNNPSNDPNDLNEFYCRSDGEGVEEVYKCPNGCKDGACLNQTQQNATCTDSDGGLDYYVKGNVQIGNNIYEDMCIKDKLTDLPDSKDVSEYICANYADGSPGSFNTQIYKCPNGCKDGACKDTGNCEKSQLRLTNFKTISGQSSVDVQIYSEEEGAWMTIGSDAFVGKEVYYKNLVISIQSLNVAGKRAEVNIKNGEFDSVVLQNGKTELLHQQSTVFESDEVKYFIIADCSNTAECDDLILKVKNPKDFVDSGIGYTLSWNNFYSYDYWINNQEYSVVEYYASWYTDYDDKYYYLDYNVLVFDDENINLEQWLKDRTNYLVCRTMNYWGSNNQENKVYICNWDVLRNEQDLGNYQYNSRQVLWTQGNIAVQINVHFSGYLTDEEVEKLAQKRLNDFLNDLKNNEYKYVSSENFDIDWPLSMQIEKSLAQCPSEISLGECSPSWECKIEPIICPEHGYQTKTCRDYSCDKEEIQEQIYCSPGICSGCYVPRWYGDKWGDNKCIPYGFRFEQETGWDYVLVEREEKESLSEEEAARHEDVYLDVISNQEATLIVYDWGNKTYTLTPGAEIEVDLSEFAEDDLERLIMVVDKIVYLEGGDSYVEFTFRIKGWDRETMTIDSYCDIDGRVKQQKIKQYDGSWAKCQNSYECESNLCSGGDCIEINDMLKQASGLKSLAAKVLCWLADSFGIEESYESCVADYLEPQPTPATTGSGGGGAGS